MTPVLAARCLQVWAGVQDSPPAPADLAHPQQGGRAQQTAQHFGRTWI